MRAYTVATVALSLSVSSKWLDNTLSHNRIDGVIQAHQGVSRKLSPHAVLTLHIALRLIEDLEMPLKRALELAGHLARSGRSGGVYPLSRGLSITLDVDESTEHVNLRLAQAVEITPLPRRGRPPTK
jgi:hypothetical protein